MLRRHKAFNCTDDETIATVELKSNHLGLVLIFPAAFRFVEMAARELRYFWWVILLVALALWLIWGIGRKPKQ
jgi:hypothetical protein